MYKRQWIFSLFLIALALMADQVAFAQSSVPTDVTYSLRAAFDLQVTLLDPSNFEFDDTDKYDNGIIKANRVKVRIKATVPWAMSAYTDATYFSSRSSSNMPAGILSLRQAGSGNFISLGTSPKVIVSGRRGNNSAVGNDFNLDFWANPGYGFDAAAYTIGVIYTLSAQ